MTNIDRLKAELRQYKELAALQDARLRALQAANEGAYRDQYDAASGPHFCTRQPIGEHAPRVRAFATYEEASDWLESRIRTEPDPNRRAAWRMLRSERRGQA